MKLPVICMILITGVLSENDTATTTTMLTTMIGKITELTTTTTTTTTTEAPGAPVAIGTGTVTVPTTVHTTRFDTLVEPESRFLKPRQTGPPTPPPTATKKRPIGGGHFKLPGPRADEEVNGTDANITVPEHLGTSNRLEDLVGHHNESSMVNATVLPVLPVVVVGEHPENRHRRQVMTSSTFGEGLETKGGMGNGTAGANVTVPEHLGTSSRLEDLVGHHNESPVVNATVLPVLPVVVAGGHPENRHRRQVMTSSMFGGGMGTMGGMGMMGNGMGFPMNTGMGLTGAGMMTQPMFGGGMVGTGMMGQPVAVQTMSQPVAPGVIDTVTVEDTIIPGKK